MISMLMGHLVKSKSGSQLQHLPHTVKSGGGGWGWELSGDSVDITREGRKGSCERIEVHWLELRTEILRNITKRLDTGTIVTEQGLQGSEVK